MGFLGQDDLVGQYVPCVIVVEQIRLFQVNSLFRITSSLQNVPGS